MLEVGQNYELAHRSDLSLARVRELQRGNMGEVVANDPMLDADLATHQRTILRGASSGIDIATNSELRARLDSMALGMVRRGYSRDVRAAGRYFLKMRQLDIATAKAMTDAIMLQQLPQGQRQGAENPSLSEIKSLVSQAKAVQKPHGEPT